MSPLATENNFPVLTKGIANNSELAENINLTTNNDELAEHTTVTTHDNKLDENKKDEEEPYETVVSVHANNKAVNEMKEIDYCQNNVNKTDSNKTVKENDICSVSTNDAQNINEIGSHIPLGLQVVVTDNEEKDEFTNNDDNSIEANNSENVPSIKIDLEDINIIDDEVKTDNITIEPVERKVSLSSHIHPQRKYSREVQVHYTEQLRGGISEGIAERETRLKGKNIADIVETESVNTISKDAHEIALLYHRVNNNTDEEMENTAIKNTSVSQKLETDIECDFKTQENFNNNADFTDFNNVKTFDIRERSGCRISGRKKAVFTDHRDVLNNEAKKSARSFSLQEQRRTFIIGARSNTIDTYPDNIHIDKSDDQSRPVSDRLASIADDDNDADKNSGDTDVNKDNCLTEPNHNNLSRCSDENENVATDKGAYIPPSEITKEDDIAVGALDITESTTKGKGI